MPVRDNRPPAHSRRPYPAVARRAPNTEDHAPAASVFLSEDLALHLDAGELLARSPVSFFRLLHRTWLDSRRIQGQIHSVTRPSWRSVLGSKARHCRIRRPKSKCLSSFRTDSESLGKYSFPDSIDISHILRYGIYSETAAHYTSFQFLTFLNRYEEIRTDRLHVCIAGALLGKQVQLYPGNYYKCEAVYQHSIRDRFPNVSWHG